MASADLKSHTFGWIGTGKMGYPMAERLIAHELAQKETLSRTGAALMALARAQIIAGQVEARRTIMDAQSGISEAQNRRVDISGATAGRFTVGPTNGAPGSATAAVQGGNSSRWSRHWQCGQDCFSRAANRTLW